MGLAPDTPRRSFRAPAPTASALPRWTGSMSDAPAPRSVPAEPEAGEGETRGAVQAVIHLPDERQRTKKITSGSENRQRTQAIRVRLHPADADRLKTEAAAAGMSVAGYLASGRLDTEIAFRPRFRRRRASVDVAAFMQGMVSFNRAANLLNQQTRALNTLALFAEEHGEARLAAEVRELRREIERQREQFAGPVAAIHAALRDEREG
jgi:hypothetical protein